MYSVKTRDLRLASYLWAQPKFGVSFEGLIPIPQQNGMFYFTFNFEASQSDVDQLISDYNNDRASVEPNSYMAKMSRLRDSLSANSVSSNGPRR